METIVFPDVVKLTIDYLTAALPTVGQTATVHSRVPNPRPDKFVTVQRTGGIRQTIVTDGAQVTVDVWADQEPAAYALAALCLALLHDLEGTVQDDVTIYGVHEFSGPALLPDPLSSQPRVTFTIQIVTRGTA